MKIYDGDESEPNFGSPLQCYAYERSRPSVFGGPCQFSLFYGDLKCRTRSSGPWWSERGCHRGAKVRGDMKTPSKGGDGEGDGVFSRAPIRTYNSDAVRVIGRGRPPISKSNVGDIVLSTGTGPL